MGDASAWIPGRRDSARCRAQPRDHLCASGGAAGGTSSRSARLMAPSGRCPENGADHEPRHRANDDLGHGGLEADDLSPPGIQKVMGMGARAGGPGKRVTAGRASRSARRGGSPRNPLRLPRDETRVSRRRAEPVCASMLRAAVRSLVQGRGCRGESGFHLSRKMIHFPSPRHPPTADAAADKALPHARARSPYGEPGRDVALRGLLDEQLCWLRDVGVGRIEKS